MPLTRRLTEPHHVEGRRVALDLAEEFRKARVDGDIVFKNNAEWMGIGGDRPNGSEVAQGAANLATSETVPIPSQP